MHIEREKVQNIAWRQTIAEMKANSVLNIYSLFPIQSDSNEIEIDNPFNEEISESVRRETAIAASDTLVRNNCIGRCWIIANQQNRNLLMNTTCHKKIGGKYS